MKKLTLLLWACIIVGALIVAIQLTLSLFGPNEYAARIAEAQADLETARALRDQAEAIQVIGAGLGRVSFVQSLTLFLLVGGFAGLVGWLVYLRLQNPKPGPARPAQLGQVPQPGLPEGLQGLDPALLNQVITLEILKALRSMNAPQLPVNVHHEGHKEHKG